MEYFTLETLYHIYFGASNVFEILNNFLNFFLLLHFITKWVPAFRRSERDMENRIFDNQFGRGTSVRRNINSSVIFFIMLKPLSPVLAFDT